VIREQPSTIAEAVNIAHKAESFLNIGTSHSFTTSNGRSFVPRYSAASSSGSSGSSAMMDINNIELDQSASEFAEDHAGADHRGESIRLQQLTTQVNELKSQQKVQQLLLAMFGNHGSKGATSSGTALVPDVSKQDYAKCQAENRCLNCRTVGHIARECTKPRSFKW
jgi:hypothetical protein